MSAYPARHKNLVAENCKCMLTWLAASTFIVVLYHFYLRLNFLQKASMTFPLCIFVISCVCCYFLYFVLRKEKEGGRLERRRKGERMKEKENRNKRMEQQNLMTYNVNGWVTTLETITWRRRNWEVKKKRRYVKMEKEKNEEEQSSVTYSLPAMFRREKRKEVKDEKMKLQEVGQKIEE